MDNLLEIVKSELGSPVINVELTDDQINYQIEKAKWLYIDLEHVDHHIVVLATALSKRLWGFILCKYDIKCDDRGSIINSKFIYDVGVTSVEKLTRIIDDKRKCIKH